VTQFGNEVLTSEFPDDDGAVAEDVLAALQSFAKAPGVATRALVASQLRGTRLLVPVVAMVVERAADGSDKKSEIQQVYFESDDGRQATLAFTSLAALQNWDPLARPIPQLAELVAANALEIGHDALILDFAENHRIALTKPDLIALATPGE
jgi:SseB protein N-terminal domain